MYGDAGCIFAGKVIVANLEAIPESYFSLESITRRIEHNFLPIPLFRSRQKRLRFFSPDLLCLMLSEITTNLVVGLDDSEFLYC